MKQIVHMKRQVSTWPGCTAPLCGESFKRVASYNWPSVTCKRCLRLRKLPKGK